MCVLIKPLENVIIPLKTTEGSAGHDVCVKILQTANCMKNY